MGQFLSLCPRRSRGLYLAMDCDCALYRSLLHVAGPGPPVRAVAQFAAVRSIRPGSHRIALLLTIVRESRAIGSRKDPMRTLGDRAMNCPTNNKNHKQKTARPPKTRNEPRRNGGR